MIGATNVRCNIPRMPASSTKRVGDELETLGVELVRLRLALGHSGAHLEGPGLELAPDAVRLDRLLVAIPRHPFDADSGDVAAEAPEPLDESHLDTGACSGECGSETGWAGADDQHVGLVDDIDLAGRLGDGAERSPTGG